MSETRFRSGRRGCNQAISRSPAALRIPEAEPSAAENGRNFEVRGPDELIDRCHLFQAVTARD